MTKPALQEVSRGFLKDEKKRHQLIVVQHMKEKCLTRKGKYIIKAGNYLKQAWKLRQN